MGNLRQLVRVADDFLLQYPEILSVFPRFEDPHHASLTTAYLGWYGWWVHEMFASAPDNLFNLIFDDDSGLGDDMHPNFIRLWNELATLMKAEEFPSIDEIISQLVKVEMLPKVDDLGDVSLARRLIFTVLGWQTMLFNPETGNCPPSELAIADEMDGYAGQGQIVLKQDISACKRSMSQLLLGFGVLLPPLGFKPDAASEMKDVHEDPKSIQPSSINAFVLKSIGNISLRWVDSLSSHLEFDSTTKTLYLFRFASFCVANIPLQYDSTHAHGVVHGFGAPASDLKVCASADDISLMLRETVLSYRLLFGQSKEARAFFRTLNPFEGIPERGHDAFLNELCARKRCSLDFCRDRETYDLDRHFPIYKSKIVAISKHMSQQRPRTWKDLWKDRRNSAQWFTLWAVLVLGGLGIFLALLQVILQIVQIVLT